MGIRYWESDRIVSVILSLAMAFTAAGLGDSHAVGQDAVKSPIPPSPGAGDAMSGVTIVPPAWSHLNLNLDRASELEAESLARGYLELKYVLKSARLARFGANIRTLAIADIEKIDSSNADNCIRILETRLAAYGREIEKRGYSKLSDAYMVKMGGESIPTLVEQIGFELTWSADYVLYPGVVVEQSIAIEDATNPEITFVGKLSGSNIRFKIESVGVASTIPRTAEFEMAWTENDGAGQVFAMPYLARAITRLEQDEFASAITDLGETLARDRELTTAYALRSQILAMCPLAECRNGDQAMSDANRYCALYPEDGSGNWTCHSLRTAAHAENGEFTKAVELARRAEALAPPEVRQELRNRLQAYESGQTIHLGANE